MLQNTKNQAMLITGESGAGKTENTKKVITYLAIVAASSKKVEKKVSLEDQIVATNPILESYGNAKTARNDNSSRFGKFIRIHFNAAGKLSGADMVVYLLEKSRLTYQQPLERCYHAFYNMMSDEVPDLKEKCLLSNDIKDYWFVSQGKLTVPSIDDREDMQFANEAFDVLGFSQDQKYDVFKNTACMMHMGNMCKDFVPVGKEEQAEIKDEKNCEKVATLLGIDCEWMITYFCKPKLKVGTEWVSKGSSCNAAASSVSGIARALYERKFTILEYWTLLGLKSSTTMASSKFVSTTSTRSCSSSLINTCSHLSRKNMSGKAWTGLMLILVWTCRNVLTCLKNQWAFLLSLKRNPFSQKLLIKLSVKSFIQTCLESGQTLPSPTPDPTLMLTSQSSTTQPLCHIT